MIEKENIKEELLTICHRQVNQRISNAQFAMDAAQLSANMEEKSSAGDKYETGRAMAQLERDRAALQLNEAIMLRNSLGLVNIKAENNQVRLGSLVYTSGYNFFIATSLGKHTVKGQDYFVIGPATPVGKLLLGLQVGNQFSYNKQVLTIQKIL